MKRARKIPRPFHSEVYIAKPGKYQVLFLFMTHRIAFLLAILFTCAACNLQPAPCTDRLGCIIIQTNGTIEIGVLVSLDGEYAYLGNEMLESISSEIEESNSLYGHEIMVIIENTDCSKDNIQIAITHLSLDPALVAVIGPSCPTSVSFDGSPLATAGIPFLPQQSSGGNVYRQIITAITEVAIVHRENSILIPRDSLIKALQAQP
jgi:ABC-type branched-subunit amino acid transport system substrate-binding protein